MKNGGFLILYGGLGTSWPVLKYFFILSFFASSVGLSSSISLINGNHLDEWIQAKTQEPAPWKVTPEYIEVTPGSGDIETKEWFEDFDLHVEFWIPSLPDKVGQDRGNSGIFLQGRYEIQILDSWQNETYLNGACGSLYKLIAPETNASLPPEHWQTYDIQFTSPRLNAAGEVITPGEVTVIHNGKRVINRGQFVRGTGSAAKLQQGVPGPIRLQDHGSPVRFRNLVITPR